MNELDALTIRCAGLAAGIDGERAVEVVDDEQQLQQEIDHGLVGLLAALALDAFAVVVELRALAHPAILEIVALALEVAELRGHGRARRVGRVGQRFISHRNIREAGPSGRGVVR